MVNLGSEVYMQAEVYVTYSSASFRFILVKSLSGKCHTHCLHTELNAFSQ